MLSPEQVFAFLRDYSPTTQSAIAFAARIAGAETISDATLSNWLRGKTTLSAEALEAIKSGMSAIAAICHDGYRWPLDFSSPKMGPLIREYVSKQRLYLVEKAMDELT
jgi:transcriptional regulator with XRE-family HTH domain